MSRRQRAHQKPWRATSKEETVIPAAIATAKFAVSAPELKDLPRYQVELLHNVLWLVTVAPSGKNSTRYRSAAAVSAHTTVGLRHEHVFPRKWLVDRILGNPSDDVIDFVLSHLAIGCAVTKDEHDRLTRFDRTHEGWDRYIAAGIDVLDMETGERLDLASLAHVELR